jgi:hypothetical protein
MAGSLGQFRRAVSLESRPPAPDRGSCRPPAFALSQKSQSSPVTGFRFKAFERGTPAPAEASNYPDYSIGWGNCRRCGRSPLQKSPRPFKRVASKDRASGEMAEWLKAHAWKACVRETVPWVRIPLSPPYWTKSPYLSALPEIGYLAAHIPAHTSDRTGNELFGHAFNWHRCVVRGKAPVQYGSGPDLRMHPYTRMGKGCGRSPAAVACCSRCNCR